MYRRAWCVVVLLVGFSRVAFGVDCNKGKPIPRIATVQDLSVILPLTPEQAAAGPGGWRSAVERDLIHRGAHFEGEVNTKWEDDGRCMTLLNAYSYFDGAKPELEWGAWTGMGTDGATIPEWAWSLIGGPFEGKYRNAAVVHDAACLLKNRTWEASADMFYDAMRTAGVGWTKAHLMYAAVAWFGPKWPTELRVKQSAGLKSEQILENLRAHNITMSDVRVTTEAARDGSGTVETVVSISPPARVYAYTIGDFIRLKQALDADEKAHPHRADEKTESGSITRETIKNWQPQQSVDMQ